MFWLCDKYVHMFFCGVWFFLNFFLKCVLKKQKQKNPKNKQKKPHLCYFIYRGPIHLRICVCVHLCSGNK